MFLVKIKSAMENLNFEGNLEFRDNVVTVDVIDTRFITVSRISRDEYIMSDIELDDNDIPNVIETIYVKDVYVECEKEIINYISKISDEINQLLYSS
jgi:hypothetical protein